MTGSCSTADLYSFALGLDYKEDNSSWIAMTCSVYILGPQRMNSVDFGDPVAFSHYMKRFVKLKMMKNSLWLVSAGLTGSDYMLLIQINIFTKMSKCWLLKLKTFTVSSEIY